MTKIISIILFIFSLSIGGFILFNSIDEVKEPPKTQETIKRMSPTFETQEEMYKYKIKILEEKVEFRDEIIEELKENKSQLEKVQNLLLGLSALILNMFSIVGMVKKWKPKK